MNADLVFNKNIDMENSVWYSQNDFLEFAPDYIIESFKSGKKICLN